MQSVAESVSTENIRNNLGDLIVQWNQSLKYLDISTYMWQTVTACPNSPEDGRELVARNLGTVIQFSAYVILVIWMTIFLFNDPYSHIYIC